MVWCGVVWSAERRVVHTAGDAQYSLHQDTFHQVVKLWVYPANLSAADGALQVPRPPNATLYDALMMRRARH